AKYANASAAAISLARSDGALRFTVSDDGAGFDPGVTSYGTGLQGMADRLDAIGGSLSVTSTPGEVGGRAAFGRPRRVLRLLVGRQQQDDDGIGAGKDLARRVEPVDTGQVHVHQHEIGLELLRHRNGGLARL